MLDGISRYDDISDLQFRIKRSGYSGIDDLCATKIIDQRMSTDTGIDFTHSTFDNHNFLFSDGSFTELHGSDRNGSVYFCFLFQKGYFFIHGPDDANCFLVFCCCGCSASGQSQTGNKRHNSYFVFSFHEKSPFILTTIIYGVSIKCDNKSLKTSLSKLIWT